LTPITLCVFERDRLSELFKNYPALGYDLTWIAAREERVLDETLLSVGQRSAIERAAYLLAALAQRARTVGLSSGAKPVPLPLTQVHVADTLGLSVVHTNKTLKRLSARNLIRWRDRGCDVMDIAGLAAIAGWVPTVELDRPFI
jgi:CRP-like cAMP-binding protein